MRSSVYVTNGHPSVCHIDLLQHRQPAGLLLSADVCSRYRSTAGSAVLQVSALSSKRG